MTMQMYAYIPIKRRSTIPFPKTAPYIYMQQTKRTKKRNLVSSKT